MHDTPPPIALGKRLKALLVVLAVATAAAMLGDVAAYMTYSGPRPSCLERSSMRRRYEMSSRSVAA
jgi:hypothetical protein